MKLHWKIFHMWRECIIIFYVFIFSLISGCSCTDEPVGPDKAYELTALDVGVTEVWLKLTVNATRGMFVLRRNDDIILSNLHSPIDTILYFEGLLPKYTYTYKAGNGEPLTITTMDTTSHDFSWQIDTLGVLNSNVLQDVTIINDTLAYAVGKIYQTDSAGQLEKPYSMAVWNGKTWQLKRLYYNGTNIVAPIRGIFAYGDTDVWLAAGGMFHWNRVSSQTQLSFSRLTLPDPNATIEKVWGRTASNIFGVGFAGTLVHYSNGTWQPIDIGTTQTIQDVFGIDNSQANEQITLCAVSHPLGNGVKKILSVDDNNIVDTVPWAPQRVVMSVWLSKPSTIYTCGGGVFRQSIDKQWKEIAGAEVIPTLTQKVRGKADNDIFVVGGFGVVAHFNGVNFKLYPEVAVAKYYSCDYKGNTMIAVGVSNGTGFILRMWR
jgi:hypothetical protein